MKHGAEKLERMAALAAALLVPLYYAVACVPYGMDTTDFGFFYGYAWHVAQGEVPYRDFMYINPALPLYWHALWVRFVPETWQVLAGKATFWAEMLASAWFGALFLARIFDFKKLGLPVALLAVTAFVWGAHTFPAMPWHTADGVFFGSAGLYAVIRGLPALGGALCMASMLTKQSFFFMPVAAVAVALCLRPRAREALWCALGAAAVWTALWAALSRAGAWEPFKAMTTDSLRVAEAMEAGVLIYVFQEWWLPLLCLLPWLCWRAHFKARGEPLLPAAPGRAGRGAGHGGHASFTSRPPDLLQPFVVYFFALCGCYVQEVLSTRQWIGYGISWPMLLVLVGGLCVLLPGVFLRPWAAEGRSRAGPGAPSRAALWADRAVALGPSAGLGAALLLAWSSGISGGYKVPAFFAAPLLLAAALAQTRLGGTPRLASRTVWTALVAGLIMFGAGWRHPYVFPQRPMPMASLVHNAGQIFPKADGVYVDGKMLGTLRDLRDLRAKYGPGYRTLPGFPMAAYLTGDKPAFISEWLLDWQINARVNHVYNLLVERDLVVFFEKDQLDVVQPDAYARARYSVPQLVRKTWRVVDETEYFLVFRRPSAAPPSMGP